MSARMKFHVDHNVRPLHVIAILKQMSPFVPDTRAQLHSDLTANNYTINPHHLFWSLKVMRVLGMTDTDEKGQVWRLTRRGVYLRALAEWNQRTFHDIMHYLYYAVWDFGDRQTAAFSWTYQTIASLLWQRRPMAIDGKALAAEVRDLACQQFGLDSVSITDYAVDGVYNWVRALDPAFAWTGDKSRRRETNSGRAACTPELFLMAVDYLYRTQHIPYNRPVVLDDEQTNIICRLCLLDPVKTKYVLNRTTEQFPILRRVGSASGPQITLGRAPRLIVWPGEQDTAPVELDVLEEAVVPRRDDERTEEDPADDEEDLEE